MRSWRRSHHVRTLGVSDRLAIERVLDRERYTSLLAATNLPHLAGGSGFLGIASMGELEAVAWTGSNLVPVGPDWAMTPLAHYLARRGRRTSSIVGSAPTVAALWEQLERDWPRPREKRMDQPCLVMTTPPTGPGDDRIRRARLEDLDILFPAAVAMYTEEVGYDPTSHGDGYQRYVQSLAASGRSFIIVEPLQGRQQVVFKADIGALWNGIAQIQGVWTHPQLRGKGLATAGMAAATRIILDGEAHTVSLYVNAYNLPAIRVYEKVGFQQRATYATILL